MGDDPNKWPIPGEPLAMPLRDVPVGSKIVGLAPIGIRWEAVMTKKGVKPLDWPKKISTCEFVPCYAYVMGEWREVV